jgi:hypothetical protein
MTSGDLGEHARRLASFLAVVPPILRRNAETSSLADEIEASVGASIAASPLVLAVVGPVKRGKSTLINALLGSDIAAVGFTETTAAPTFIGPGEGEALDRIRVRWRVPADGAPRPPDAVLPMTRLDEFLGEGSRVGDVECLFVADPSALLERIRLVDVPGTRSIVAQHERAARDFATSGEADAVLHVLSAGSVRRDELEALEQFTGAADEWGSRSYNSLAVIQRWDALGTADRIGVLGDDPFERIRSRLPAFRSALGQRVAEVLPVSGLLALCADRLDVADFDRLRHLAVNADASLLEALLASDDDFCTVDTDLLPADDREAILGATRRAVGGRWAEGAAGWPAVRMALWLAARHRPADGPALAVLMREASGIDRLLELLERRFFPFARLIREGNVLRRAIAACEDVALRLGAAADRRQALADEAGAAGRWLRSLDTQGPDTKRCIAFADAARAFLDLDREGVGADARQLAVTTHELGQSLARLTQDVRGLQALDSDRASADPQVWRALFDLFGGGADTGLTTRLGCPADASSTDLREAGHTALARWRGARWSTDLRLRELAAIAEKRVEDVMDDLATGAAK